MGSRERDWECGVGRGIWNAGEGEGMGRIGNG